MMLLVEQMNYLVGFVNSYYDYGTTWSSFNLPTQTFTLWVIFEVSYVPILMIIDIIFLLLRSLFEQHLHAKMPGMQLTEDTDFIYAQFVCLRFCTNTLAPAMSSFVIKLFLSQTAPEDPGDEILATYCWIQLFQGLPVLFLIFNGIKANRPEWQPFKSIFVKLLGLWIFMVAPILIILMLGWFLFFSDDVIKNSVA